MHGNDLTAPLPHEAPTLTLTSTAAAAGFASTGGAGGEGKAGAEEDDDGEEWETEERQVTVPLDGLKRFMATKGDKDKVGRWVVGGGW